MCEGCGYEGVLERIEKMLISGKYRSSYDILNSIRQFVKDRNHITIKQEALVMKIGNRN